MDGQALMTSSLYYMQKIMSPQLAGADLPYGLSFLTRLWPWKPFLIHMLWHSTHFTYVIVSPLHRHWTFGLSLHVPRVSWIPAAQFAETCILAV